MQDANGRIVNSNTNLMQVVGVQLRRLSICTSMDRSREEAVLFISGEWLSTRSHLNAAPLPHVSPCTMYKLLTWADAMKFQVATTAMTNQPMQFPIGGGSMLIHATAPVYLSSLFRTDYEKQTVDMEHSAHYRHESDTPWNSWCSALLVKKNRHSKARTALSLHRFVAFD